MNTPHPLPEIISELTGESGTRPIPRQRVLDWMGTDDIECMGAMFCLITGHFDRIQPPLQFDEYHPFAMTYFQRCLLEDPQGEWADTRYAVGPNIIRWFAWLWRTPNRRTTTVAELKEWLGVRYVAGDAALRTCIVQATLEHLFENREVAEYFSDWKEHPVLSTAYAEAMEWVDGGGRSPFWM